jgi:hypothetical protein
MAVYTPMQVPCELRANERSRWFRLTAAVAVDALAFTHRVPEELEGAFEIAFHLPGDAEAIRCRARASKDGDTVVFASIEESAALRISDYIKEQLSS